MSRAYTKEEARKKFLDQIHNTVDHWENESRAETSKEKLDGLAFSILSMIDGSTMQIPSINIVLNPHTDDKEYHQEKGTNWFEEGMIINDDCHLHEFWHNKEE